MRIEDEVFVDGRRVLRVVLSRTNMDMLKDGGMVTRRINKGEQGSQVEVDTVLAVWIEDDDKHYYKLGR